MFALQIILILALPLLLGMFFKSFAQIEAVEERLYARLPRIIRNFLVMIPLTMVFAYVLYAAAGMTIELAAAIAIALGAFVLRGDLADEPTFEYRLILRLLTAWRSRKEAH